MEDKADSILQSEVREVAPRLADFLKDKKVEDADKLARDILVFIDKCGIKFIKFTDARLDPYAYSQDVERIAEVIKGFVRKLKHPRGIADVFPSEELAHTIKRMKKEVR